MFIYILELRVFLIDFSDLLIIHKTTKMTEVRIKVPKQVLSPKYPTK